MDSNNQTDLQNQAKVQGEKLAYLLSASKMPKNQKEAWLALLPEMTLEQIEKLISVLETQYVDQQTKDVDQNFNQKLQEIEDKYQAKINDINQEAENKINNLTKDL